MINLGRINLIGVPIYLCDYDYIITVIIHCLNKKTLLINPVSSNTLVISQRNSSLLEALKNYQYLLPDSYWMIKAADFLYHKKISKRVYGPELMHQICNNEKIKNSIFFLLGNSSIVTRILSNILLDRYKVKKCITFPCERLESVNSIVEKIVDSKANILFLSFGSVKDQLYGYELYKEFLKRKYKIIIIPVGAAFDFISGRKSQAPEWMGNNGFEWLFRLVHEPTRLWKRYLIYGPLFLLLIIHQKISLIRYQKRNNH